VALADRGVEGDPPDRGTIARVAGPLVEIEGFERASMSQTVAVGPRGEVGEIVRLADGIATAQVYEYTGGIKPGDPAVTGSGALSIRLGPGLLGRVFDGLLRPLSGAPEFLRPAEDRSTTADGRRWTFKPAANVADEVRPGVLLGEVEETPSVVHPILVPPGVSGRLEWLADEGEFDPETPIATVDGRSITMSHEWPVRTPRPSREATRAQEPLFTGQRVLDLLFPIPRGGTAAVPGGFGEGKTVLLQQIAKWSDADVIVYVGCGERGNEMADVLSELPQLEDPRSGRPLLERTVIIANTSNMPVMAREASIYTGITVGEYFRDLGYDALVIADSTSRWAEALREFASRTGELPVEEGYPASLSSALAAFYERAGRVETLGGQDASVTVIASVSPPGGDFTEPVTSHTRRYVRSLWSLDRALAAARHYPAVSWTNSFSQEAQLLAPAFARAGDDRWLSQRTRAMRLLAEEDRLSATAQLVGLEAMPDRERMTLLAARLLRQGVLQQNAESEVDAYSSLDKGSRLLAMVLDVRDAAMSAIARDVEPERIEGLDWSPLLRARSSYSSTDLEEIARVRQEAVRAVDALT
jgi:V/A-type H+-transporting ATPase subunit A